MRHLTRFLVALVLAGASTLLRGEPGGALVSLDGAWRFALDAPDAGLHEQWFAPPHDRSNWRTVTVPHTWQVEPGNEAYQGAAWYAREIAPEPGPKDRLPQIEFAAVNRDATVWLNGTKLGDHLGSGYTPFRFLAPEPWDPTRTNLLVVRVDNRFSTNALPFSSSFDWPVDGGIIRSVRLRLLPDTHIASVKIDAVPNPDFSRAAFDAQLQVRTRRGLTEPVQIDGLVFDPGGQVVLRVAATIEASVTGDREAHLTGTVVEPQLWHFDQPRLYRATFCLRQGDRRLDEHTVAFGVRRVEIRPGRFLLNGEPMRLMGVEWMPGSDPRQGLAEDRRSQEAVLTDLKRLNCVLTRFHWQQDDAVFDFTDREGILVQEEVPTWGHHPLTGTGLATVQQRHLREMIAAHYHRPSIFAWGICNEIKGLSAEGREFVERGRDLARAHDPHRLLTYASNTLQYKPENDAAGLLDFISWNEYYGSWFAGGVPELLTALQQICRAWPQQAIVISEYGLCECAESNPVGDARRIDILRSQTEAFRQVDAVAGAIFFNYNDYRTHMGDKSAGAFQQRVHGVTDLRGRPKPSWEALRREASPIRELEVQAPTTNAPTASTQVRIATRSLIRDLPAYTLRGYRLVWTAYDRQNLPRQAGQRLLPDLPPGTDHLEAIEWPAFEGLTSVAVEVHRPTGYLVLDAEWQR